MNVWLTRAALRIRGLSAGAFRVLLAHVDACSPSGRTCLAGLEELAEACELSPKHVMRLRAQLIEAGHLRRLAAAHPGQRPIYEVLPAMPIPLPNGPGRSAPPPTPVTTSGRAAAGNGSRGCNPPYKPQGITPPTPPATPSTDPVTGQGGGESRRNSPSTTFAGPSTRRVPRLPMRPSWQAPPSPPYAPSSGPASTSSATAGSSGPPSPWSAAGPPPT